MQEKELTDVPETACTDMNGLKGFCMDQAEKLRRNEGEISALKKQVMEFMLSASE